MTRIAPEDMTTLQTASAVKAVAATAVAELEEMSIAHLINEAANCGETSTVCNRPISSTLQATLTSKGYVLSQPAPIARVGDETIISWS